ncbi:MAG: hypothetical protein AAGA99_00460 [Actinomycetota bacterium]
MRIGLDLDGTIVDFSKGVFDAYETWYGTEVPASKQQRWDSVWTETVGDMDTAWSWLREIPGFWVNLAPIKGALGGVLELARAGHELEIITNRPEWSRGQTQAWLVRHWPHSHHGTPLHFVKRKSQVRCDLYIDDSPEVLEELAEAGRTTMRFTQPWNRDAEATCRATGWKDVLRLVERMSADPSQLGDELALFDEITDKPTEVK